MEVGISDRRREEGDMRYQETYRLIDLLEEREYSGRGNEGGFVGPSPGIGPIMATGGRRLGDRGLPSHTISPVLQKVEARRAKVFFIGPLQHEPPHHAGGAMAGTIWREIGVI